jgi:hypothetical protein
MDEWINGLIDTEFLKRCRFSVLCNGYSLGFPERWIPTKHSFIRLTVFPSLQQRSFNCVDQNFTWFSLDLGQTLILYQHSALFYVLFLQLSNM